MEDLGSECSAAQDNKETMNQESNVDDNDIKTNNGLSTDETEKLSSSGNVDDTHGLQSVDIGGEEDSVSSPSSSIKSPSEATKGYGLKKWKRIRRDSVGDTSAISDGGKALKREFSDSENQTKPTNSNSPPVEVGSTGSANMSNGGGVDGFAMQGSSSDSRFAIGPAFVPGTNSENSEDRSSKSSTAASAPKIKSDVSGVPGYASEKNKPKNLSVAQRVQQGRKGHIEISKKPRGERVKVKKENSHSSIESDSRSSNFVFVQGSFSAPTNSKPSGRRSMNYDGENSDEAHVHARDDFFPDDVAEDLSWEGKQASNESDQQTSGDPLDESMRIFLSMQEALKKEIQKFREIGKESSSLNQASDKEYNLHEGSTFTDPEAYGPSHLRPKKIQQSASTQVSSLKEDVKYYETKLKETKAVLDLKTSRVTELEASLNTNGVGTTVYLQWECRELENELETLFQQKIEAEIEYLALTRTILNLRVAASNNVALFEEQKALAADQTHIFNNLGDMETKARTIKKQVENMEKQSASIVEGEEILTIQRRVYKATSRFLMQFVLLLLVVWFFVDQLSPRSGVVVPT